MLTDTPSGSNRIVTSIKVAALVAILGSVVLAAEQRKEPDVSPGPAVAGQTAQAAQSEPGSGAQEAATDYFPAQFPAPSGPVAEVPPSF